MSGPALQPGTIRAWKVFTAVACTFTGYQMIFRTDYGDKEHVFSPVSNVLLICSGTGMAGQWGPTETSDE